MAKGPSKQTRRRRKAARQMRGELALAETPRREPNGRYDRKTVAPRKVKPLAEQKARRDVLLKGQAGDPDDPLDVTKAQRHLSERQCEALYRYRNIANAFRRATGTPRMAPDILATLEPSGGDGLTDEEALKRIQTAYHDAREALAPASRKEADAVDRLVSQWGCILTPRTCETLRYPADLLATHFGM